jgi:hypothetical protein
VTIQCFLGFYKKSIIKTVLYLLSEGIEYLKDIFYKKDNAMMFKQIISIFLYFFAFTTSISAQELSINTIKNLSITHEINRIYDLKMIEKDGLLIGDTRLDGDDLDGLLVRFNLKGRVLKEIRLGRTDSYERIVKLEKTENGYFLLMNSVKKDYTKRLLFYQLDNALGILSSEIINVPNLTATAMTYDAKRKALIIVASIKLKEKNFPRLITYDLASKKIIQTLDLNKKNRAEKTKPASSKWIKKCNSIRFSNDFSNELILTGQESSSNGSDFWVAKVIENEIIWEDRFPTTIGADEGHSTFKTPSGYLSFGHEHTQKAGINYTYRTLALSENGKKTNVEQFNTGKKDWFKDVVRLGERHFVLFGQSQASSSKSIFDEEKTTASNLWAIMVDDKGKFIVDYEYETEMIDQAHTITRMDSGDMLMLFRRDGDLKIGILELVVP